MKKLRILASVLLLGPAAMVVAILLFVGTTDIWQHVSWIEGNATASFNAKTQVVSWTIVVGTIGFIAGVVIHWLTAKHSNVYSRGVWNHILTMSGLFCFLSIGGALIGGTTIVLLFVVPTFKKMRIVEQSP